MPDEPGGVDFAAIMGSHPCRVNFIEPPSTGLAEIALGTSQDADRRSIESLLLGVDPHGDQHVARQVAEGLATGQALNQVALFDLFDEVRDAYDGDAVSERDLDQFHQVLADFLGVRTTAGDDFHHRVDHQHLDVADLLDLPDQARQVSLKVKASPAAKLDNITDEEYLPVVGPGCIQPRLQRAPPIVFASPDEGTAVLSVRPIGKDPAIRAAIA